MNLIYYYPLGGGSPSSVAREIFRNILRHSDNLPFDKIIIYSKKNDVLKIKHLFPKIEVFTFQDLLKIKSKDIVHIPLFPSCLPNTKFLLYCYCLLMRRKLILNFHGNVRAEIKHNLFSGYLAAIIHIFSFILAPLILRKADTIITNSFQMKDILLNYDVNKVFVIANALDNYWLEPISSLSSFDYLFKKECFTLFYHGRLSYEKGIDILLNSLAYLRDNTDLNPVLLIAGNGPFMLELDKIISKLELENSVVFLGDLNRDDIKVILSRIDLAIYPSRFDNFPLSVLEALACANCPVCFSKNIGIYDYVINSNTPLKYFELDAKKMSELIIELSCSDNAGVIKSQKNFARNFMWEEIIMHYLDLYKAHLLSQ